jgi:hypothetical protein
LFSAAASQKKSKNYKQLIGGCNVFSSHKQYCNLYCLVNISQVDESGIAVKKEEVRNMIYTRSPEGERGSNAAVRLI